MTPQDCSKFQTCSAPICPIDPRWPSAVHLDGERVCPYLLASGKPGAAERYATDPAFRECLLQLPLITGRHPDIRRRVVKAARSGFKSDNLGPRGTSRADLRQASA